MRKERIRITIYKMRTIWWMQYRINGKRFRESTGEKIKWIAERKAKAKENEINSSKEKRRFYSDENINHKKTTFEEFWIIYYPIAKQIKRLKTLDNEKRIWKAFIKWIGTEFGFKYIHEITKSSFHEYRAFLLEEKNYKETSVNVNHRHLSAIFSYAVEYGFIEENPLKKIKRLKVEYPKPRFLSLEEIKKVLKAAESKGDMMHIVFALGIFGGFRKSEIANARWEWFDFENKTITIQAYGNFIPKSHRSRPIPFNNKLMEILGKYRKPEGYCSTHIKKKRSVLT